MRKAPAPRSADPGLPFKYVGGEPDVDLVNTVDWTARGPERERLTDYDRLTHWAEGAGVVSARQGARLRRAAAARRGEAAAALHSAAWLRWTLRRLYAALATGGRPGAALDDFNELLGEALRHLRISTTPEGRGDTIAWDWLDIERLDSLLWPVLWSAANLLTSEETERIRVCDGPDCGWIYVDRSRNGLRRWCEMETCGTHEKSRRRRLPSRR